MKKTTNRPPSPPSPSPSLQAKINERGVAAVAYNVLLREGVTFGIGASFDTQKLDQATHKVRVGLYTLPCPTLADLPSLLLLLPPTGRYQFHLRVLSDVADWTPCTTHFPRRFF